MEKTDLNMQKLHKKETNYKIVHFYAKDPYWHDL